MQIKLVLWKQQLIHPLTNAVPFKSQTYMLKIHIDILDIIL